MLLNLKFCDLSDNLECSDNVLKHKFNTHEPYNGYLITQIAKMR